MGIGSEFGVGVVVVLVWFRGGLGLVYFSSLVALVWGWLRSAFGSSLVLGLI